MIPVWSEQAFVRAVERTPELRVYLQGFNSEAWSAASRWKSMNGAHCGLYRSILKVLFANALAEDPDGFQVALRTAGYSPKDSA